VRECELEQCPSPSRYNLLPPSSSSGAVVSGNCQLKLHPCDATGKGGPFGIGNKQQRGLDKRTCIVKGLFIFQGLPITEAPAI
jgi:hypothetical protein